MLRKVDFDENGPSIGSVHLLRKTFLGFVSRDKEELAPILSRVGIAAGDIERLSIAAARIAHALNDKDISLAAIITSRIQLPSLRSDLGGETAHPGQILKASVDDSEHPGYPAGEPGSKGGEFRPKDAELGPEALERAERLKRLARRRTFRSVLSRVLSAKRVARMLGKYVEAEILQDIPIVNDALGVASLKDDFDLLTDIGQDVADSDAAIEFARKGPVELKNLQRSPDEPQSFSSFQSFKKIECIKQYGPAGDGYDYHHIVEQGSNAGGFTQEQLQSTENIVRVPRLLHEELNSYYGSVQSLNGELTTPRLYLRDKSFEEQRQFGIYQLRRIGVIQ